MNRQRRPRLLAFAWACDPDRGSESGAGWGLVHELATFAEVVVLVHPRHIHRIREWERTATTTTHLEFVAVEEGSWGRKLQQRSGVLRRLVWRGRYLWWLRQASRVASRLEAERPFDAALHLTLGIYWLPSPVVDLRTPSIWGPVDGAAASPPRLRRYLGIWGLLAECSEVLSVRLMSLLPWTRRTWFRATLRLVETESTRRRLPRKLQSTTGVVNRAFLVKVPSLPPVQRDSYLLYTSPLQSRKAPSLAVHALALTPHDVRLVFVNTGPEEAPLRRLAKRLGVADRVEFRGKVSRDAMWHAMAKAAACVFTGLREVGGAALAEAMLAGAPVVVLAHNGSRILAEANTDPARIAIIAPTSPRETVRRMADAMARFSASPPSASSPYLDREPTLSALRAAVEEVAARGLEGGDGPPAAMPAGIPGVSRT